MLSLRIAYRFLSSKRIQTLLIIIGFGIGIGTNIFVGNLIMAIENDLIDRTINSQPHITIDPNNSSEGIENWKTIRDTISDMDEITASTHVFEGRAFIMNINPATPEDIIVRGMGSLDNAAEIYDFYNDEFRGTAPDEPQEVIIGVNLAEDLEVNIGDKLNVSKSPVAPIGRIVEISGIYDIGNAQLNRMWIVGNLIMSGFVLYELDKVNSFIIQVEDHMEADIVASQLSNKITNPNITINNWKVENSALLNSLQAQSSSVKVVQFFILLSVAIAIASVLGITVSSKNRQIGILKAMGITDDSSGLIFFWQGTILGIIGAFMGLLLGLFFIFSFNQFTGPDIVTIFVQPSFVLISMGIAILAAMIASVLPSFNSRKLDVIDIIREY